MYVAHKGIILSRIAMVALDYVKRYIMPIILSAGQVNACGLIDVCG